MMSRRTMPVLLAAALFAASYVSYCSAQAPAAEGGAAPAVSAPPLRVESKRTLWDLLRSGGWAMWPLGTCSVATLGLIILNFQRVNQRKLVPLDIIGQIKAAAAQGDLQQMWTLSSQTDSLFTRSLAAGLKQVQPDDPIGSRPKVENAIAEAAGQEEAKYGFYVNFLALLTSMSPMWGLLGTVSGMIGAFSKIGAGGMGKPELLARNIGEALVCTASGLMIAITAMGFYFLFRNILNGVMKASEKHFGDILDIMTGQGCTFGQPAVPAPADAAPAPEKK